MHVQALTRTQPRTPQIASPDRDAVRCRGDGRCWVVEALGAVALHLGIAVPCMGACRG